MDMTTKAVMLYDEIAEEYSKKIGAIPSINQFKLFSKYVSNGNKVLDAGCAAGRDCRMLFEKGYDVTGIDLSKNLLTIAKRENPKIPFMVADIRSLPFSENTFDGIWANAVIHHLTKKDIKIAIKEFYRVLKPEGYVFVTTKRGEGQWRVKEDFSFDKEREFTLLNTDEFIEIFNKQGFIKKELIETKSDSRDIFWIRAVFQK